MTNEEAIFDLEQFAFAPIGDGDLHRESVELALSALREQVEREKGCEYCSNLRPAHNIVSPEESQKYNGGNFCYKCGRRLEAQHECIFC